MTMIERIARAIDPAAFTECSLRTIEHRTTYGAMQAKALRQALAVLEAMLDLPMELKLIGAEKITLDIMKANANYDAICEAWPAIIKAAIAER